MTRIIMSAKLGLLATIDRNLSVSISHSSIACSQDRCAARRPFIDQRHLADDSAGYDSFIDCAAAHYPQTALPDDIKSAALIVLPEQKLARANRNQFSPATQLIQVG